MLIIYKGKLFLFLEEPEFRKNTDYISVFEIDKIKLNIVNKYSNFLINHTIFLFLLFSNGMKNSILSLNQTRTKRLIYIS